MAGLFSLTPQNVRQQQAEQAYQRGIQRAQLPRGRGGVALAGQAGGLFGQAIQQVAGGKDKNPGNEPGVQGTVNTWRIERESFGR